MPKMPYVSENAMEMEHDFNGLPKPAQRKAFHFCYHLSNDVLDGILANSECAGLQVGMIEIFHQLYNIYLFGSFLSDEFYTFGPVGME